MEEKLKKVMSEVFNISIENISNDSSMENIEKWDSISHIEFIVSLEKNFGIRFSPEEIIKMTDFSKVSEILNTKNLS